MLIAAGTSPTIENNIFHNNQVDILVIRVEGGRPTIRRNVFYENLGNSCIGVYSGAPLIINNTFDRNNRGMYSFSSWTVAINNIVSNSAGYGIYGGYSNLSYNNVYNNNPDYLQAVPDTGNISADPLYLDADDAVFHLTEPSPCIDSGHPGPQYRDPDGSRNDMGAFPFSHEYPFVVNVRIDTTGDNLHILDPTPLVQWDYAIAGRAPLLASELEFGTDADWTDAELWAAPQVPGPTTTIEYGGAPIVIGNTYYVRIRVRVDTAWSEWRTVPFAFNRPPTSTNVDSPIGNAVSSTSRAYLTVHNASDADGDVLWYDFEVYEDSMLASLVDSTSRHPQEGYTGSGNTTWRTDVLTNENQRHWWRARAWDGYQYGGWSTAATFWLNAVNESPAPTVLAQPDTGDVIYELMPPLAWHVPIDPDPGDYMSSYTATIGLTPTFALKATESGISDTTFVWPDSLPRHITYYWTIRSFDSDGLSSVSDIWSFRITDYGDLNRDESLDVVDLNFLIEYLFLNGDPPDPLWTGDLNGDCFSDAVDMGYMIDLIFFNGPPAVRGCE
ncbi:MAG: hypothetical protein GF341_01870 [candidate division Zixibacteria bacterium]|nr:hypothetical protein [candidate division Zixibacteria bacterium]